MSNTTAISASFYKNVFVLTQLVPTSDEFKEHFRVGMFDKPNTTGFIQVSYYLLMIFDAQRFKKLIQWPIHCKKTQTKYRNDIKDYLGIISRENPDFGFPPIRASDLLHAGGTKFIIIMWKLSQLVLYTYMKREHHVRVPRAPRSGLTKELSKTLLRNTAASINATTMQLCNDFTKRKEEAETLAREKSKQISKIQSDLFERRQSLSDLATRAPVASHVRKRLIDVEDVEIIQMWRNNVTESLKDLQNRQKRLRDLEAISNEVVDMTMSMLSNCRILDVRRLPKVDVNVISELALSAAIEVPPCHLYVEDKLVLRNFLLTFNALLRQLWRHLKDNRLPDMSQCQLQVQASCEDMSLADNLFRVLVTRAANISSQVQGTLASRRNVECEVTMREDVVSNIENVLFMPSPTIEINTNPDNERHDVPNRLELTPIEGIHRTLFSRHKRSATATPQLMRMKMRPPFVSRINFDDTISSSSVLSDKQSPNKRTMTTSSRMNASTSRTIGKYSRLFSGHLKRSSNKGNCPSVPVCSKASSTVLANATSEICDVSEVNLNVTAKSLFNLMISEKIVADATSFVSTPETLKERGGFCDDSKIDRSVSKSIPVVEATTPPMNEAANAKLLIKGFQQPEQNSERRKRRSISDLVERYKKVLENSSTVTLHLESMAKSTATIESVED